MEQRIEKLERQCRLYRNLLALLLVGLVALVSFGAEENKHGEHEKRLKNVELEAMRNAAKIEQLRLQIRTGSFGVIRAPSLEILSPTGSPVIIATGRDERGWLQFRDKKDLPVLVMGAVPAGYGHIGVYSNQNTKTLEISGNSHNDTGGVLYLRNKTDEAVVTLQVDAYGNGEVGAWNRKGKGRTLTPQ